MTPRKKRGAHTKAKSSKSLVDQNIQVVEPSKGTGRKDRTKAKADQQANKAVKSSAPVDEKRAKAKADAGIPPLFSAMSALAKGNLQEARKAIAKECKGALAMMATNPARPDLAVERIDACLDLYLPRYTLQKLETMHQTILDGASELRTDVRVLAVAFRMDCLVSIELMSRTTKSLEKQGFRFDGGGNESALNEASEAELAHMANLSFALSSLAPKSEALSDLLDLKGFPLDKRRAIYEVATKALRDFAKAEPDAIALVKRVHPAIDDEPLAKIAAIGTMPLADLKRLKDAVELLSRSSPKEGLPSANAIASLRDQIAKTEQLITLQMVGAMVNESNEFDVTLLSDGAVERLHRDMAQLDYVPKALEIYKKEIDFEYAVRKIEVKQARLMVEMISPKAIANASLAELEVMLSKVALILSAPKPEDDMVALAATSKALMNAAAVQVVKADAAAQASSNAATAASVAATASATASKAAFAAIAKDGTVVAEKPSSKSKAKAKAAAKAADQAKATAKAATAAKAAAKANDLAKIHAKNVERLAKDVSAQAARIS